MLEGGCPRKQQRQQARPARSAWPAQTDSEERTTALLGLTQHPCRHASGECEAWRAAVSEKSIVVDCTCVDVHLLFFVFPQIASWAREEAGSWGLLPSLPQHLVISEPFCGSYPIVTATAFSSEMSLVFDWTVERL